MTSRYKITEKSIANKKLILALCHTEPKTLKELSAIIGRSTNALRHTVIALIASKHLKVFSSSIDKNGRPCFTYLSTDSKFMPQVTLDLPPHIAIHIQSVGKPDAKLFKPLIEQVNATTRRVYLTDHVKTKGIKTKIDPRHGSTLGSMTFQ
jgi:predicted ArsR family transcriptional regulator